MRNSGAIAAEVAAVLERTEAGVSSLMDTWILLKTLESDGERNRGLYVLKSRGMSHSNQIREMRITSDGVRLEEVYLGLDGVHTGAARKIRENQDRVAAQTRKEMMARRRRELERKRELLEAQIAALKTQFAAEEEAIRASLAEDELREVGHASAREEIAKVRQRSANSASGGDGENGPIDR